MKMFGKGANRLEIAAAEYLPNEGDLYVFAIDAQGIVHTYKFDPSSTSSPSPHPLIDISLTYSHLPDPQSLSGQRLLLLSTYNTGSYCTSMILLPRTPTAWERLNASADADAMDTSTTKGNLGHQILCNSANGSLSLLTTLAPAAYRTLAALQSYLTTTLAHPLGLNPKAHRAADADLSVGGRVLLDGDVLRRWTELGAWKRAESVARVGLGSEWEVRALLEGIGTRGMGFL